MSYNVESCCNKCLLPWDVNRSLKHLFEFLMMHQENPDGSIEYTNLYLGIASQNFLSNYQYKERVIAFNLIYGKILDATEEYVIIESNGACAGLTEPYIIWYSEIQSIYSSNITKFYHELLCHMQELPPLCKYKEDDLYQLLQLLSNTLCDLRCRPNMSIVVMYAKIFSQVYAVNEVTVERNIVFFKPGYASPITWVNGFFIVNSTKAAVPVLAANQGREVENG